VSGVDAATGVGATAGATSRCGSLLARDRAATGCAGFGGGGAVVNGDSSGSAGRRRVKRRPVATRHIHAGCVMIMARSPGRAVPVCRGDAVRTGHRHR
jgi:hypothetical protein